MWKLFVITKKGFEYTVCKTLDVLNSDLWYDKIIEIIDDYLKK